MSKGALDRLGERLALHGQIPEDDAEKFAAVADAYQDTLDQVEQHLADLGFAASTRVKTTGVLIEKLRRESSRLRVQDLAGAADCPGRSSPAKRGRRADKARF